jgi:hypothetical protein
MHDVSISLPSVIGRWDIIRIITVLITLMVLYMCTLIVLIELMKKPESVVNEIYFSEAFNLVFYQVVIYMLCLIGNKGEVEVLNNKLPKNQHRWNVVEDDYGHLSTDRRVIQKNLKRTWNELFLLRRIMLGVVDIPSNMIEMHSSKGFVFVF